MGITPGQLHVATVLTVLLFAGLFASALFRKGTEVGEGAAWQRDARVLQQKIAGIEDQYKAQKERKFGALARDSVGDKGVPDGANGIHLNAATEQELIAIPGIGPTIAKRIVEYRKSKGPYQSIEELLQVKGIGKKTLKKIRPFLQL